MPLTDAEREERVRQATRKREAEKAEKDAMQKQGAWSESKMHVPVMAAGAVSASCRRVCGGLGAGVSSATVSAAAVSSATVSSAGVSSVGGNAAVVIASVVIAAIAAAAL